MGNPLGRLSARDEARARRLAQDLLKTVARGLGIKRLEQLRAQAQELVDRVEMDLEHSEGRWEEP